MPIYGWIILGLNAVTMLIGIGILYQKLKFGVEKTEKDLDTKLATCKEFRKKDYQNHKLEIDKQFIAFEGLLKATATSVAVINREMGEVRDEMKVYNDSLIRIETIMKLKQEEN